MSASDVLMEGDNETMAKSPSHDEMVWTALRPELEGLKGDIVCLVPNSSVKAQVKQKFEAKEKVLKTLLADKIVEVVSLASVPSVPEWTAAPSRVNIADLKANLADELSDSLKAVVEFVQLNHKAEGFLDALSFKQDFYGRKLDASLAGSEQQVLDRSQPHGAFGPLDFERPSLEADFPFDTDAISRARADCFFRVN